MRRLTKIQLRFLRMAAEGALSKNEFKPTERALERRGLIEWHSHSLGDGHYCTTYIATEEGLQVLSREG